MLHARLLVVVLLSAPFAIACGDPQPVAAPPRPVPSHGVPDISIAAADAGHAAPPLPAIGKPCTTANTWTCLGARTVGACIDGVWMQSKCRGPNGCRPKEAADADCDESIAEEGESCLVATDVTCSPDKKRMLRCIGYVWRLAETCSGELGCVPTAKKVTCDNSIAAAGDGCLEDDDYACSADLRSALVCRGGHFTAASSCSGPKHCSIDRRTETAKVLCDDSIATVGDPCSTQGHYSCSPDHRTILVCKASAFALDERCKAKEACAIRGEQVGCY